MKKLVLSTAAILSSAFVAHSAVAATNLSQDYNFVSGGVHYNHYKEKMLKKEPNLF